MAKKETLYKRQLRRPLDDETKKAIESEFLRRRHEIPIPTELTWHRVDPEFTIKSPWMNFIVRLEDSLVVDAELSFAARMFATDANRQQAVKFIESIADDLGL